MGDHTVRVLADDELPAATKIVGRQMLGSVADDVAEGWAELFRGQGNVAHGAFAGKDLVGCAAWFPTSLSFPGEPVRAAGVTAVSVLSNHRRQGHLSRLMEAELHHAADAGSAVAVLLAAEWPIYGRFGYGFATESCSITLDTGAARLRDAPTGTITLADPAELRAPLQEAYLARWARNPGAITRVDGYWDHEAGLVGYPGRPFEPGKQRGALWHDDDGQLGGAIVYSVDEIWTANRPDGVAEVQQLWGATPEAERELWRHLLTVDWIRTAKVSNRPVDDPLPFWLEDGRTATLVDHSDNLWLRVLDVPTTFGARRSATTGSVVLEVDDPMGFAAGRWRVELGPDDGVATPTTDAADLRLSASTLGAALLGGHSLTRLAQAGLVQEERAGALATGAALLQTPTAPWCPVGF
jgi:predicted acetyltransferase